MLSIKVRGGYQNENRKCTSYDHQGKGEDEDLFDEEASQKEEEPIRMKGKVFITKPSEGSTVVSTRRSKKKGGSEVVFSKPPPTFQKILKKFKNVLVLQTSKH